MLRRWARAISSGWMFSTKLLINTTTIAQYEVSNPWLYACYLLLTIWRFRRPPARRVKQIRQSSRIELGAVETLSVEYSVESKHSVYRDPIMHKYVICVSPFGLLVAIDLIVLLITYQSHCWDKSFTHYTWLDTTDIAWTRRQGMHDIHAILNIHITYSNTRGENIPFCLLYQSCLHTCHTIAWCCWVTKVSCGRFSTAKQIRFARNSCYSKFVKLTNWRLSVVCNTFHSSEGHDLYVVALVVTILCPEVLCQ